MTIKLTITYDGTNISGWQRQNNAVSVQGVLEEALFTLTKEKITVIGSGRTDAGVHAVGQVASFRTKSTIPSEKFAVALNTLLPQDVKVLKSEQADDDFNANRKAKRKTYRYSIYNSDIEEPLKERYKARVFGKLDYDKMVEASKLFIGEHDFLGFCASGYSAKTTVRTIFDCRIEKNGEDIDFYITGNGFLYNMVRIIVGTLVLIGSGKIDKNEIERTFTEHKRHKDIKTMPAHGLCLMSVDYEEDTNK